MTDPIQICLQEIPDDEYFLNLGRKTFELMLSVKKMGKSL